MYFITQRTIHAKIDEMQASTFAGFGRAPSLMMHVLSSLEVLGQDVFGRDRRKELDWWHAQRVGDSTQAVDGWIGLASLDIAQIGQGHIHIQRDLLLRDAALQAQPAEVESDLPSNIHGGSWR